MSIWTLLLLLAFVGMIAMHLRMHLRGHAGHGDREADGEHHHGTDAPETLAPQEPRQSVGAVESHGGHGGHRHAC